MYSETFNALAFHSLVLGKVKWSSLWMWHFPWRETNFVSVHSRSSELILPPKVWISCLDVYTPPTGTGSPPSSLPISKRSFFRISTTDVFLCEEEVEAFFFQNRKIFWIADSGFHENKKLKYFSWMILLRATRTKHRRYDTFNLTASLHETWLPVWPDLAIFCFLGKHSKPEATIILPKSPTLSGNFCKGVKSIHFSSEIIFGQLL